MEMSIVVLYGFAMNKFGQKFMVELMNLVFTWCRIYGRLKIMVG